MELLESPEDRGYPAEYLLSRIRGRRASLITDWRPLISEAVPLEYLSPSRYGGLATDKTPEGVWRSFVREYRWVYVQMNRTLREAFKPFFLYTELRTLFICLRHLKDKNTGRIDSLLAVSLLSDEIKGVLNTSKDIHSAVAGIERLFLSLSNGFRGLTEIADAEGLRGVEGRLTNTYLVHTLNAKLHPLMRDFFIRIIDSRNIISLYKYLRMNITAPLTFIPGGAIPETRLGEILKKKDLFGIGSLIREISGIKMEIPGATQIENALYRGITKFLKKAGKDPLGIGLILDYLWRCSIEAMNLSLLFYGKDLERDAIAAELVH